MSRNGLRRLLCALALGLAAGVPQAAGGWDLAALMALLGSQDAGRAHFVERKHLAILDRPVESSGELRFRAPDRLEKLTLAPRPESLVLDGDTLTVTRDARRHVLKLSDYPQVAAFIDSIRGTLAGDRAALERVYALDLAGSAEGWTLTLLPRDARMAESVVRITIDGARAQLRAIEILQADGDRSVMEIRAMGPLE